MKTLLLVLILSSLTAQTLEARSKAPQSYYEMLGKMYDHAEEPIFELYAGSLWAGRCFEKTSTRVYAGAMIFMYIDKERDRSAAGLRGFGMRSVIGLNERYDEYDDLSSDPFLKSISNTESMLETVMAGKALYTEYPEESMGSYVKIAGEYFVEEKVFEKDGASEVIWRCYYFKSEDIDGEGNLVSGGDPVAFF